MPKLMTDNLMEGMVVESDVKNIDDMLLVPAGCELTERHIRIFQAWGIEEVAVKTDGPVADESDPLQKLPPETAAEIISQLKNRFRGREGAHPFSLSLFQIILHRKARQFLAQRPKK